MDWPDLAARPLPWLTGGNADVTPGDPLDAVVLTRLLAFRNLAGLPFPASATPNQCAAAADRALAWLGASGHPDPVALAPLPPKIVRLLREREILPWRAVAFPGKKGFKHLSVSPDGSVWVLVNEVEHLTLGRLFPGSPHPAEAAFPDPGPGPEGGWAHSPRFGFLASDPSRIGPGVAIEQVLHLPGLAIARRLPFARNYLVAAGLSFAPATPLKTTIPGPADVGLFRVASRGAFGRSPQQAYAGHLEAVAPVLAREAEARRELLARHPKRAKARVRGALERLISSPTLSHEELLAQASWVRLGTALGLVDREIGRILESLRVTAASGHLAVSWNDDPAQEEEDFSRANVVRLSLEKMHGAGI